MPHSAHRCLCPGMWMLALGCLMLSLGGCGGGGDRLVVALQPPFSLSPPEFGMETGILLSGGGKDGNFQDRVEKTTDWLLTLGPIDQPAGNSRKDVIGFRQGRPVAYRPDAGWTGGSDTVILQFAELIRIPVTVWIVHGPFEEVEKLHKEQHRGTTLEIWQGEAMGIEFADDSKIIDRTVLSETYGNWPGDYGDNFADRIETLREQVGHHKGRINIYYVDTVRNVYGNDDSTSGESCFLENDPDDPANKKIRDTVILGSNVADCVLAHEIGHCFSLRHVNEDRFNSANVMWASSDHRKFLTEGQTFRAHVDPTSALNQVYGLRGPAPTLNCPQMGPEAFTDDSAPPLDLRIWGDGDLESQMLAIPALAMAALTADCADVEPGAPRWIDAAYLQRDVLIPIFRTLSSEGPDEEARSACRREAALRHAGIAKLAATGKGLGLSAADLEILRRRTKEEFVARAERDFVQRIRSRAEAALRQLEAGPPGGR